MPSKTKEQISSDILNSILQKNPNLDVSSGSILKDIVADAIATLLEITYQDSVDTIRHSHSVNYINSLSDAQVNDIGANFQVVRKVATVGSGSITFFSFKEPGSPITINSGTTVSTQKTSDGIYYSYQTTETVTLSSANYNVTTELWEVNATIAAAVAGIASNVAVGAITGFSNINGVDGVINRIAVTGGTDQETNALMAERIIIASQARLIGTVPGYKNLVLGVDGVLDVAIVTPNDTNRIRSANGNETDVIIVGDEYTAASQAEVFSVANGLTVNLDLTPIYDISSVIGVTRTFIQNTDYVLVPDTTGENALSNRAGDKLVWLTGYPAEGENYSVNSSYNKLVSDVQDIIDNPDNAIIASDVLVRQGKEIIIDITLTAALFSGTNRVYAESQIKTVLGTYINSLLLGDKVEQSDLVFQIRQQLSFVDNVVLPFTKLCRRGGSGVADIILTNFEYPRIDASSITISLV